VTGRRADRLGYAPSVAGHGRKKLLGVHRRNRRGVLGIEDIGGRGFPLLQSWLASSPSPLSAGHSVPCGPRSFDQGLHRLLVLAAVHREGTLVGQGRGRDGELPVELGGCSTARGTRRPSRPSNPRSHSGRSPLPPHGHHTTLADTVPPFCCLLSDADKTMLGLPNPYVNILKLIN